MKLPKYVLYSVASLSILLLTIGSVKSDISDDECGVDIEVEPEVRNSTDKPQISVVRPQSKKSSQKFNKKSLLIAFDGTNSMRSDLNQMRDAAKKLITDLSGRDDKPIKNYVLTVFKDPSRFKILIHRTIG